MSDLDAFDGSVVTAGEEISKMLIGGAEREATPETPDAPIEGRPRGPDGKFLKKPTDEDEETPVETGEEPPVTDDEEPTPEEPAPQDEAPKEPPKDVVKVKVKVDGIEREEPLDEVIKGYSRTADYTRKTQALAEERRAFVEQELAPVREERKLYAERLDALHAAVQSLLPETEPDWHEVRSRTTPEEFTEAFANWRGQQQRVEKIRAEQARVSALIEADQAKQLQAKLAEEHEKLKAALPEMADAEKGKALKDDLIAYAKSLSFSDDDLAQVTDHRVLVLLDKARRFDEAQLRKPKIEAKIDRALETIKPNSAKSKPKMTEIERAKNRLKETGRIEDAAALINRML